MLTWIVRSRLQDGDDKREEAERLVADLVASVHDQEPGAFSYAFHRNVKDPQELVLVETYSGNDEFLEHNMSPHMLKFRSRFTELFQPETTQTFMVEEIAGFGRVWPEGNASS